MVFQQLLSCHNGNGMDWLSSLKGEPWISGQKHAIDDFFQIKTRTSNKFLAASFLEGPPTLGTASAPPRPHQGPTTSGQDGSTTSTGNIVPERPSHTPNMQLPHPAPGHEAKEYRSLADDPQTFPFDLSNLQKIPDDVQKMYLVRKRDMLRKHQMAMNMNYQNPDDVPDGQAFATKLPADPDPICQQLHNCPDRFGDFGNGGAAGAGGGLGTGKDGLMGDGTGPSSDSELLLDDGGAGAANDGRYDPIPEDDALDAAERSLMPCDGYGRIETAGKFPSMGEYCTDPHKRGYNICVSILPTDFAKRTGGFCYSSVLNAASNSQWFYEKNHRWHRQPMMIAAREDPSVGHRKVKTNLADVYEIKDTKGMYWPITLLKERPGKHTYESLLFDHNLTPMGLAEVDAINIRAYGGKDFDVGDRVVLSKLGMGAPAASNKAALTVTGPSMAGTIVSRSKTAGGNSWDVVSDVGRKGSFAESQLMHTGRNFDRQVGPRTTLQIDSEYVWKKPKGGGGGGNSSMFGSFLSGGAGGGKHHDFAVVLKKLEPPNGQLVTVELFDPETKDWHVHEHVPRTELLLPPGLTFQNTGKTVDICRSHIAHSYCITSRALYRYMHGHPTDNAHAAIELNCLATTDRRTVRGQGWGGSNCARYLRTQPPYDHFRIGEDGNWKVDGNITWDNVEPQHPLSAETPFL